MSAPVTLHRPREHVLGENQGREKVGGRSTGSHLEVGSGASELKGFLFFTCLHVLKNKKTKNHPGHCFKMSPRICALPHLYFDLGSTPGKCRGHVGPRSLCCGPSANHRVRSSSPVGHCCCPHPHLSWLRVAGLWPQPAVRNLFLIELIF